MVTKKKLSAIKGLSDAKVDKIREALLKSCGDGTVFCTALEVAVKRKNCFHIATGKLWFNIFFSHNFLKKDLNNAFNWQFIYNKATLGLRSLLSKPARLAILRKNSQIIFIFLCFINACSLDRDLRVHIIYVFYLFLQISPFCLYVFIKARENSHMT